MRKIAFKDPDGNIVKTQNPGLIQVCVSPKGPCASIVETWPYSIHIGTTLNPKSISYDYMDPWGIRFLHVHETEPYAKSDPLIFRAECIGKLQLLTQTEQDTGKGVGPRTGPARRHLSSSIS